MKYKLFITLLLIGSLTSCNLHVRHSLHSSHETPLTTQTPKVSPFERIEISGAFIVNYRQDDSVSVRVQAPASILKNIVVASDGNTLVVKQRSRLGAFANGHEASSVEVFITSPDLISVSLAGSGDFKTSDLLDTDHMHVSIAGSGNVSFEHLLCDMVDAEVAGSGTITGKKVTTGSAKLNIAGSGDIDMHFEQADNVNSSIAGSGDIRLSGNVKSHSESIAGSGKVIINGKE